METTHKWLAMEVLKLCFALSLCSKVIRWRCRWNQSFSIFKVLPPLPNLVQPRWVQLEAPWQHHSNTVHLHRVRAPVSPANREHGPWAAGNIQLCVWGERLPQDPGAIQVTARQWGHRPGLSPLGLSGSGTNTGPDFALLESALWVLTPALWPSGLDLDMSALVLWSSLHPRYLKNSTWQSTVKWLSHFICFFHDQLVKKQNAVEVEGTALVLS